MNHVLLFALPSGFKEWVIVTAALILMIVWVRTLIEIFNSTSINNTGKLLWFLFVFFTGIVGIFVYKFWDNQRKASVVTG